MPPGGGGDNGGLLRVASAVFVNRREEGKQRSLMPSLSCHYLYYVESCQSGCFCACELGVMSSEMGDVSLFLALYLAKHQASKSLLLIAVVNAKWGIAGSSCFMSPSSK